MSPTILFSTSTNSEGGDSVFAVSGELDLATAPVLQADFDALLARGVRRIALDLSDVAFVDSDGLDGIVGCHVRAEATGAAVLSLRPSPSFSRLLALTAADVAPSA